ncbi:MAG: hypothetical protein ONB07_07730 [candidate division KSB1 bacterium]|nr:hypothetical protein [candidate division KSB1 bacterium]MDZ7385999.1 hypothetical protein [candidate division KSB1 bacterium]MDZ7392232.1 hypothetical protein [candidate division KSB1 bacterium]MDZ7412597.1 hypothetical protein [candidate division KSB1 bacterium]
MRGLALPLALVLAALMACSKDQPYSPERPWDKLAEGSVAEGEGGTVTNVQAPGKAQAKNGELVKSEEEWFCTEEESWIYEVHPRPDPTLSFNASSSVFDCNTLQPINIYWVRVHSTAYYRPVGDPKWHFLEEHSDLNYNWYCALVHWESSMPFAWEGKMESTHGYKMSKSVKEYTKASGAGPVLAHEPMRVRP